MLENLDIANVLFLDIETVSGMPEYSELSEPFQKLWKLKSRQILRNYDEEIEDDEANALYSDKAGIFAEFGKIVCISVGIVVRDPDTKQLNLRLKSFANDDEAQLLQDFSQLVDQYYNNPNKHYFCGHNIREFDIPYLCRRLIINQLPLPRSLNIAGKKPWETKHLLDTLELWKFGDYKHYTSLHLLTNVFGISSPKEDIDGSEVGSVYWKENDLGRIAEYCEKDVLAVVQLLLKYMRQAILEENQIVHVDKKTV
jgi:DNA polymerase elongation subunit (family B)